MSLTQLRIALTPAQYAHLQTIGTPRDILNAALPWPGTWRETWPTLCEQDGRYFVRMYYPAAIADGLAAMAAAKKGSSIGRIVSLAFQAASGVEARQSRTPESRRQQAKDAQRKRAARMAQAAQLPAADVAPMSPAFAAWCAL